MIFRALACHLRWNQLLLSLVLTLAIYGVIIAVYRLCFHPLRRFPGPKIAAISRLPYLWHSGRGTIIHWIRDLHEQYGEVVRIAPAELTYTNGAAWADIYSHAIGSHGQLQKDLRFYVKTSLGASPDIVRADDATHARYRRIFTHAFSDRALTTQESLILKHVNLLVKRIDEIAQSDNNVVDLVKWYNSTTFDVMGDLTFGESLGLLEGSKYTEWIDLVIDIFKIQMLVQVTRYVPGLQVLAKYFVPKRLAERRTTHQQYCKDLVDRRIANKEPRPDIWGLALKETGEKRLNLQEMYANSNSFMVAGTETTATLLTGLTIQLLTNPKHLEKLRQEIRENFSSDEDITLVKLRQQKYLHACLEEGLRMHPPVPSGLPRITPPGGKVIAGEHIPENATYRSASNFKDPETFHPERWLGAPEFETDNRHAFNPFSTGPRACIGKNLAYHEMRLVLTKMLWHFDFSLHGEPMDWSKGRAYFVWDIQPLMVTVNRRTD